MLSVPGGIGAIPRLRGTAHMVFSAGRMCPPHNRMWCHYNAIKISFDLASMVGALLLAGSLYLKRRELDRRDPKRRRTLSDFVDGLVLTIASIDIGCSIPELLYVFDDTAYPFLYYRPETEFEADTIIFLEVNAALILLNVIWHSYISYIIYAFIVKKQSLSQLRRTASPRAVFISACFIMLAYVLVFVGLWYAYDRRGDFQIIAMAAAIGDAFFLPLVVAMVYMYMRTSRVLAERSTDAAFLTGRYSRIRRKLMLITSLVPTLLTVGFVSDALVWVALLGERTPPLAPLYFRLVAFRMIGLLDSLIFSGVLDLCVGVEEGVAEDEALLPHMHHHHNNSVTNEMLDHDDAPHDPTRRDKPDWGEIKLFVTTCNVGGVVDVASLGPIDRWIPPGYDLYIIGLQECLILPELREAIHTHLGGRTAYREFSAEIGATTILNGMIALTVLCRAEDFESGAAMVYTAAHNRLHTGVSLGPMGRAPNKGIIGLSVRYHDVSIACITAHFAADKHGKTRLYRRNHDACRALRDLSLLFDAEDFDCHLQHHFALLLGDLNYRVTLPPDEALGATHRACVAEHYKWTLVTGKQGSELVWSSVFPPEGEGEKREHGGEAEAGVQQQMAGGSEKQLRTWRDDKYAESFFQLDDTATARLRAEVALEGKEGLMLGGSLDMTAPQKSGASYKTWASPTSLWRALCGVRGAGAGGDSRDYGEVQQQEQVTIDMAPGLEREGSGGHRRRGGATEGGMGRSSGDGRGTIITRWFGSGSSMASFVSQQGEGRSAAPWRWVRDFDELTRSMAAAQILTGFRELAIRFPPSYRWVRGQTGGGFLDASRLPSCYSTSVSGGPSGSTPRTPSYTDRILLHSLPDLALRAQILAYDSCDVIAGSDHRPVAARVHLLVDRRVRGFTIASTHGPRGTQAMPGGRGGSQAGPLASDPSPSVGERDGEGAEAALSPMCLPRLSVPASSLPSREGGARGVALGQYEGPVAVWRVALSRLVFTWQGTVVDAPEVCELMCLFPLPTEDPWARDRKSIALDESFLPLLRTKSMRASSGGGGGGSHVSSGPPSLDNVHRLAYPPVPCTDDGQVTIQALVAPAFCRHVLIKFLDAKGVELGQGAICLPRRPEHEGGQGEVHSLLVPLSSGGARQMCVRLDCALTEQARRT